MADSLNPVQRTKKKMKNVDLAPVFLLIPSLHVRLSWRDWNVEALTLTLPSRCVSEKILDISNKLATCRFDSFLFDQ